MTIKRLQIVFNTDKPKDSLILEKLGLNDCYSMNDRVRDILYTLAISGQCNIPTIHKIEEKEIIEEPPVKVKPSAKFLEL